MNCIIKILKITVVSTFLLTVPVLLFAAASSTTVSGKYSFGPHASYCTPKDADDGSWYPGAQASMRVSKELGLEGSIDYRSNEYDNLTNIKTYPIQLSLLAYAMPQARFNPFFLFGAGWYYTRVSGPAGFTQDTSRFATHLGFGLELQVNDSVFLNGSYRYIWLDSVRSKDINTADKTYQDSGSMITIGLNFVY